MNVVQALAIHALVTASVACGTLAVPMQSAGAQGSPVVEMMTKGRNALNDLHYHDADSIARRVILLGSLLTPEQQVAAYQLRAAALYPEESAEQHTDSAVIAIRHMISLGAKSVPKELSWSGLDSLVAMVARASQPAKVVLGSRIPGAILFMNDVAQGAIQGLRTVSVSPGSDVKLSIRAEKCVSWDTTVVVRAADSVRVGFRNPSCPQ